MTTDAIRTFYTELLHANLSSNTDKIESLVNNVNKADYHTILKVALHDRKVSIIKLLTSNDIDPTIGDDKSFLSDISKPGFNVMDKYLAKLVRKWLRDYDTQLMMITKYPNSYKILYDNNFIHKKLKNKYNFLIHATSLNLL